MFRAYFQTFSTGTMFHLFIKVPVPAQRRLPVNHKLAVFGFVDPKFLFLNFFQCRTCCIQHMHETTKEFKNLITQDYGVGPFCSNVAIGDVGSIQIIGFLAPLRSMLRPRDSVSLPAQHNIPPTKASPWTSFAHKFESLSEDHDARLSTPVGQLSMVIFDYGSKTQ